MVIIARSGEIGALDVGYDMFTSLCNSFRQMPELLLAIEAVELHMEIELDPSGLQQGTGPEYRAV